MFCVYWEERYPCAHSPPPPPPTITNTFHVQTCVAQITNGCVFISVNANCKVSTLGGEFAGDVSETSGGIECQRWDSQSPHSHSLNDPRMFPDDTMDDVANKCRSGDF